jgi:hypothetical protein
MKRGLILLLACAALVLTVAASAAPGPSKRSQDACTWGASSVVAEVVDGKLVQSAPSQTGCIPK